MANSAPFSSKPLAAGLRRKVGLLLMVISIFILMLAFSFSQRIVHDLSTVLGQNLAVTEAKLTREKLHRLVGRELAIAQRFGGLAVVRQWLRKEDNPEIRARFFSDAEGFRSAFADQQYFAIPNATWHYYFADSRTGPQAALRYTLNPDDPKDAWYFKTMAYPEPYSLNVNRDVSLRVTNLWINIQVRDQDDKPLGLVGTGIELDRFLKAIVAQRLAGSINFMIDEQGRIVAHPDPNRIEYGALTQEESSKTVFAMIQDAKEVPRVSQILSQARQNPGSVEMAELDTIDGPRFMAFSYIPELKWTVVSSINPSVSSLISTDFLRLALIGGVIALLVLIAGVTIGFDRIVLHPIMVLTAATRHLKSGNYDIKAYLTRTDEIGELTRAFEGMATQIRNYTADLEQQVSERTAQLEYTNAQLASTHHQLTESIRYASLIQRIILPDRQLASRLHGQYFVVWQPRDVVGGDFYIYRESPQGCMFGVIDCAGHGVPGAFMTMIAHAALEQALLEAPWDDPALVLAQADVVVRRMLPETDRLECLATSMDVGLCSVMWDSGQMFFAGAHIDVYIASESGVSCHKGDRHGLNGRRPRTFTTLRLPLEPGGTVYLATDGILDQSGGARGLPFGRQGFLSWIEAHGQEPLVTQEAALIRTLCEYKGLYPQRDDITILAFRFDSIPSICLEEIQHDNPCL
ncbi:biofilm regulation protein phosphatase SiaA [Desulfatirhabdium butyrativorans]|uniref:biofilm regulation protein phosphatase SiaA n=1 Tax=Desulfatirhabdium butyrativorans TaxID=340467 RepID=UPI00041535AD|nr:biofilm regulation protein phosphatase SiaA [Desulfatirhabdium butyrativorans]